VFIAEVGFGLGFDFCWLLFGISVND